MVAEAMDNCGFFPWENPEQNVAVTGSYIMENDETHGISCLVENGGHVIKLTKNV